MSKGLRVGLCASVYKYGGGQLSLTGPVDHVSIANNVFVGTDSRLPELSVADGDHHRRQGLRSPAAFRRGRQQHDLTGFKRIDGYAGSLRISRAYRYGGYSRRQRLLIANNVIGLLRTPGTRLLRRARIDLQRRPRGSQVFALG